jgi:hypothetical protein
MREGTHFTIVDDKDFMVETINQELSAYLMSHLKTVATPDEG